MTKLLSLIPTLASALALSACVVGPNYVKPTTPASTPDTAAFAEAARTSAVSAAALPADWWRLYQDPVLDRLVTEALAHNTDIRVAAANLARARAVLSEQRGARLPTTDLSAQANYSRTGLGSLGAQGAGVAGGAAGVNAFETDFYSLGFDASYEVDLFGGVSRSIEAGRGDVGVAQATLDAARVSIAAETARTYIDACGFGAQANVAAETVGLQQRTLDLTQRLFDGGRNGRRELDQATVLVEQARAQLAGFEAERRAALYALATLTGDSSSQTDADASACAALPALVAPIPVGDGQMLLARRPDVRQAERQLAADTARVGVATAALYPSITLMGSIGLGAGSVSDLPKDQSLSWSIGPFISWNFPFNGAARARVRASEAVADGSLAAFDGAVLTALQEAQQALARLDGAVKSETALANALKASESAAFLSEKRFDLGADSFLILLDAQRTRALARSALASASVDRAQAQVALFKALGGGWENAPEPVKAATAN